MGIWWREMPTKFLATLALLLAVPAAQAAESPEAAALARACATKDIQACLDLGILHLEGKATGWYDIGLGRQYIWRGSGFDRERNVELAKALCDGGSPGGCVALGVLYRSGHARPEDRDTGAALFEKGCAAGYAPACTLSATRVADSASPEAKRAFAIHTQLCDQGSALGCSALGSDYLDGWGVAASPPRAAQLLYRACDDLKPGVPAACERLADCYQRGRGVIRDTGRARQLFEQACRAGRPEACGSVDERVALPTYTRNCESGLYGGCVEAALIWKAPKKVKRDDQEALRLLGLGCDYGSARACALIASEYASGKTVACDLVKERSFRDRTCDSITPSDDYCLQTVEAYRTGAWGAKDLAKAAALFERICDKGSLKGCYNAGMLYYRGEGVAHDTAAAVRLWEKACQGRQLEACYAAGLVLFNGEGVERDTARALDLFAQACEGRQQDACAALERLRGGAPTQAPAP